MGDENDPILKKFLSFLANDVKNYPDHIKPINSAPFTRANSLVSGIEVDLDAPLNDKDE